MKITIRAIDGHVTSVSSPRIQKIAEVYRRYIGDSDTGVSDDGVCVADLEGCTVQDLFSHYAEAELSQKTLNLHQIERALGDAFILLDEALCRAEYDTFPEPMDVPNARNWVKQLRREIDRVDPATFADLQARLADAEEYEAMAGYNEDTGQTNQEAAASAKHWVSEIERRIKRETDKMFPAYQIAAAGFLELPQSAYLIPVADHDLPF